MGWIVIIGERNEEYVGYNTTFHFFHSFENALAYKKECIAQSGFTDWEEDDLYYTCCDAWYICIDKCSIEDKENKLLEETNENNKR